MNVATIAPEAAASAHRNFKAFYAITLEALPALGLQWRLDVETREPGQSPEQQHQLIVWQSNGRQTYGLHIWLRNDGLLPSFTSEPLTAHELRQCIVQRQFAWQREQDAKERQADERADRVTEILFWIAITAAVVGGLFIASTLY